MRLPLGTGIAGHVATTGTIDSKMMVMIIVRTGIAGHVATTGVFFGHVITSPAIPDKSLIIFLKTEFCDSGKLVNIKDAYHHPLFYKVVCLYMYKTQMNIEVTFDIAEILFVIYKI